MMPARTGADAVHAVHEGDPPCQLSPLVRDGRTRGHYAHVPISATILDGSHRHKHDGEALGHGAQG